MRLHPGFLDRPLAHRALHDHMCGRPENSRAAVQAAIAAGIGIEIDLQLSADGQAMVFHDDTLDRLTQETGPVRQRRAADLATIPLAGSREGVPEFGEILSMVDGQVPLLVEIKDQDGALGPDIGALERAVASAVAEYHGPIAFMSFNPHSIRALGAIAPHLVRGLTTCDFSERDWPGIPAKTRARLAAIADLETAGASFISHEWRALAMPRVTEIKAAGLPVLCWTVRSPEEEAQARHIADNVTFEGYMMA